MGHSHRPATTQASSQHGSDRGDRGRFLHGSISPDGLGDIPGSLSGYAPDQRSSLRGDHRRSGCESQMAPWRKS